MMSISVTPAFLSLHKSLPFSISMQSHRLCRQHGTAECRDTESERATKITRPLLRKMFSRVTSPYLHFRTAAHFRAIYLADYSHQKPAPVSPACTFAGFHPEKRNRIRKRRKAPWQQFQSLPVESPPRICDSHEALPKHTDRSSVGATWQILAPHLLFSYQTPNQSR